MFYNTDFYKNAYINNNRQRFYIIQTCKFRDRNQNKYSLNHFLLYFLLLHNFSKLSKIFSHHFSPFLFFKIQNFAKFLQTHSVCKNTLQFIPFNHPLASQIFNDLNLSHERMLSSRIGLDLDENIIQKMYGPSRRKSSLFSGVFIIPNYHPASPLKRNAISEGR